MHISDITLMCAHQETSHTPQEAPRSSSYEPVAFIWIHIPSYAVIYLHDPKYHQIPSYTFINPHLPGNIQYCEHEGQHGKQKCSYLEPQSVSKHKNLTQW